MLQAKRERKIAMTADIGDMGTAELRKFIGMAGGTGNALKIGSRKKSLTLVADNHNKVRIVYCEKREHCPPCQ